MSDWQVGDLALCVVGGQAHRLRPASHCPEAGKVYTVLGVDAPAAGRWATGEVGAALILAEGPRNDNPSGGWWEGRFVKVTPPAADEFDRETIALMNRVEQPA